MKRKLAALVLAVSLGAGLLSGCGSTEEDVSTPDNSQESQEPEADTGEGEEQGEEETPADDGEVTEIKVALMSLSPVDTAAGERIEARLNEMLLEQLNIQADITWYPASDYLSQVPMAIQAGEQLDLMMVIPVAPCTYPAFMQQGQLMDITDELNEYGPDIVAALGEDGLAATTQDGRIYGVGGIQAMFGGQAIVMRKDALDAAGMTELAETMTTWDEFEQVLDAVVNNTDFAGLVNTDANGNVLTPLPYMNGGDSFSESIWVDNAGDADGLVYVDPNTDKVECYYYNEEYYKTLKRTKDYYDKGYIYRDAAISEEFSQSLLRNGVGFAMVNAIESGYVSSLNASVGTETVVRMLTESEKSTTTYTKFGFAVPVTAREPEAAIKMLNLLYTSNEFLDTLVWGEEGIDWVKKDDGTATYPEGVTADTAQYHMADFLYGNRLAVTPWEGDGADIRQVQQEENANVKASKYLGLNLDATPVSTQVTACQNTVMQYKSQLTTGTVSDVDATYQEFKNALEAAGINEVIAEYQSQLDAWLAAQ